MKHYETLMEQYQSYYHKALHLGLDPPLSIETDSSLRFLQYLRWMALCYISLRLKVFYELKLFYVDEFFSFTIIGSLAQLEERFCNEVIINSDFPRS